VILVDTSVWIDHLRVGNERLRALLQNDQVLCHPFIIGELACGNLHNRNEVLHLLEALPGTPVADHTEVLHLINTHRLYGQGLGWIDAHLLVSALRTGCELWTSDRLLHALADRVGL
jgi:predicted nucleic acid-binding protein